MLSIIFFRKLILDRDASLLTKNEAHPVLAREGGHDSHRSDVRTELPF